MKEKNTQAKTPNKKAIGLTTRIFIALIAGAILGIVLCYLVPDSSFKKDVIIEGVLYVIGQGFIRLMKMLVVPLVFCSLICGSMAIGDTKTLGKVGVKTIGFYLVTTALAVCVALGSALLINPGRGLDMDAVQKGTVSSTTEATSLVDTLLNIIPKNPVQSMANGDMLPIIVFALFVGIMLAKLGTGEPAAGASYETNAIAAAAIGGTSLAGGKGSIIGTFLGAILLQALKVGLVVCGVDTFWQYIATGLIIVFAVYVDVIQGKLAAMRLNKKAKAE